MQTPPNQGYQPIQGVPATTQESVPAPNLLAAAYGFIWVAVLAYLLMVWRRARTTEHEIDELKKKIDGASARAQAGGGR